MSPLLSQKRRLAIQKKVDELTKKYKNAPPFEIAAFLGIVCKFKNLPEGINAYSIYEKSIIYISDRFKENSYSAKIVCAHELGHLLLQAHSGTFEYNFTLYRNSATKDGMLEYEANIFAALLMPQITQGRDPFSYHPEKLYRCLNDKIF